MSLELITVNAVGPVRNDVLDGRSHAVVPVRILPHGVLNEYYYPLEEITRYVSAWDHKPIVCPGHPMVNGEHVSAAKPEILNTRRVGLLLNNHINGEFQDAEAWIDLERAKKVDQRIINAIEKKMVMELSTGLYVDFEETPGEFNGKKYKAIVRNFRPDHLALLPDQIGACSCADGCGFITVNGQTIPLERMERVQDAVNRAWKGQQYLITNCSCGGKHSEGISMKKKEYVDALISSEVWNEKDRAFLEGLEEEHLAKIVKNAEQDPAKGDKGTPPPKGDPKPGEQPPPKEGEGEKAPGTRPTTPPTGPGNPNAPKGNTEEEQEAEWLSKAPRRVREMYQFGLQTHADQRKQLSKVILANKKNVFTQEELDEMSITKLNKLAALADEPKPQKSEESEVFSGYNFVGNAGGALNSTEDDWKPEPLVPMSTLPEKASA